MPTAHQLHYYASGADNFLRPPVLLIHGAGGHHLFWPPQVRRIHGQRCFAMDLPGHGSSGGIGRHRIEEYVDDVLGFMNELRLNAAVWIGHSMGGAIALQAAVSFPRQVLGLGLIGTGARLRLDPAILRSAARDESFPAALSMLGERSFAPATGGRLKELALHRMAEIRSSVLLGDLMACDAFDVMAQVADIQAPALVLCGTQDQMSPPKYSEYLRTQIAGSRLELIEDAGHMVMLEKPDAVAEALGSFLDSIPYRPGSDHFHDRRLSA